jgi:hypothetical protein
MVDRVSACITIGGILSSDHLPEFLGLIADEELSLDWDGPPFTAAQLVSGVPLTLRDHEVALGQFIPLEDFCAAHGLPFRRWSGGCASWGPQRAVFDGSGCVNYLTVNDGGAVLIDRATIEHLGTMQEVRAWFDAADREVPRW